MSGLDPDRPDRMHPLVALMRRYCIDYTNSHDQSIYPDIFEDDYTVHIEGHALVRDASYGPAAAELFALAPGLGLVVHELVLNGDRLCMRFSEHASMPTPQGRRLSAWRGIGLYRWNGRRLTGNHVEQDFAGRRRQLLTGVPDPLEPPHLDPWMATRPVAPEPAAEAAARAWLARGRLADAPSVVLDAGDVGASGGDPQVVDATEVVVNDLFSAGPRVAFHVTLRGTYRGGLDGLDAGLGTPVELHAAGLLRVGGGGTVDEVRAVTSRRTVAHAVRAAGTGRAAGSQLP